MHFHKKELRPRVSTATIAQALGISETDSAGIVTPTRMDDDVLRFIISEYSQKGDLVVDPMCGTGTVVHVSHSLGRRSLGFDIERDYLRIAKHLGPQESFALADARNTPLADNTVGLAILCPPLLKYGRGGYPTHPLQVGNYDAHEVELWVLSMKDLLTDSYRVLRTDGTCIGVIANLYTNSGAIIPLTSMFLDAAMSVGYKTAREHTVYQEPIDRSEHIRVLVKS